MSFSLRKTEVKLMRDGAQLLGRSCAPSPFFVGSIIIYAPTDHLPAASPAQAAVRDTSVREQVPADPQSQSAKKN